MFVITVFVTVPATILQKGTDVSQLCTDTQMSWPQGGTPSPRCSLLTSNISVYFDLFRRKQPQYKFTLVWSLAAPLPGATQDVYCCSGQQPFPIAPPLLGPCCISRLPGNTLACFVYSCLRQTPPASGNFILLPGRC